MDFCSDISIIPQFVGNCWFNAILMSCFYSQEMRKLMISKISKTWDKNDNLFNFFKTILKYSYDKKDKKIIKLFNKIKPELLLLKILNRYDKKLYYRLKGSNFGSSETYISYFLEYLNVNILNIHYSRYTNKFLFNFNKNNREQVEKVIREKPDVLILYHSDLDNYLTDTSEKDTYVSTDFDIDNTELDDLREYNDEVIFNGNKYKLDSVLIINYNKINIGSAHAIAGITCNNNRYVYNGWNMPSFMSMFRKYDYGNPCSLMKYNWNLREDKEFCLNPKKCKLESIIDKEDLCFSFNKGKRLLVYVKYDENIKTSSIKSKSYKSLSQKEDIIKDFFNIDNLSTKDIEYNLKNKDIQINEKITDKEKIKKKLNKYLKENYNLSKSIDKIPINEYFTKLSISLFNDDELIINNNNYYSKLEFFKNILSKEIIKLEDNEFLLFNYSLLNSSIIKDCFYFNFKTNDILEIYQKCSEYDEEYRIILITNFLTIFKIDFLSLYLFDKILNINDFMIVLINNIKNKDDIIAKINEIEIYNINYFEELLEIIHKLYNNKNNIIKFYYMLYDENKFSENDKYQILINYFKLYNNFIILNEIKKLIISNKIKEYIIISNLLKIITELSNKKGGNKIKKLKKYR